ncbi:MAG: hypothetical protein MRY83_09215 [Flavobacteriales bacterium]|nr:hypothetical protein [Flavobacteriales bacterium]
MKKLKTTISVLLITGISYGATIYDQLCAFNPTWELQNAEIIGQNPHFKFQTDKELIQEHLKHVIKVLETNKTEELNNEQKKTRKFLIEQLREYRWRGQFPMNYYSEVKLPVFIDELGTHCAVGYLMKVSGYGKMASEIAKFENYAWVKDIKHNELLSWQQLSGLSLEEIKLIQGVYDYYIPNAINLPNRYEIPQKPEPIVTYFEGKGKNKIWLKGEGKDGVLHGSWEQNSAPGVPWIKGFFKNGKRSGKWMEYYQGTEILCRTENWRHDQLNGYRKRYDRQGKLIEKILFKNGKAIVKTNHDYNKCRTYVRRPLDSNKVYTEIYTIDGAMLAKGHEKIHNPGNLMWFQNIELTALNMAAITSKQVQVSGRGQNLKGNNGQRKISGFGQFVGGYELYNQPPLVEYIKYGIWSYYPAEQYLITNGSNQFSKDFEELSISKSFILTQYEGFDSNLSFDSLTVTYDDDKAVDLICHSGQMTNIYEMSYASLNYGQIFNYSNNGHYDLLSGSNQITRIGQRNENRAKIGLWKHYNSHGSLIKTENFIIPWKEELVGIELKNTASK